MHWFDAVGRVVLVEDIEKFFKPGKEFLQIFARSVSQISKSINNEFVIGNRGEFLFEKRSDACPSFLSCGQFQIAHGASKPFFGLAGEKKPEVGKCGPIVPPDTCQFWG